MNDWRRALPAAALRDLGLLLGLDWLRLLRLEWLGLLRLEWLGLLE